jgi:hypothetical protein
MSAQILLSQLSKVRQTGGDKWVASCPAHDDRGPSLSIAERDGKLLLHCFAGCEAEDVLGAVGLRWTDVLPERMGESRPQPIPAMQVLEAVTHEIMVAALLATELGYAQASQRLIEAGSRLNAALTLIGHEPASLKATRRAMR